MSFRIELLGLLTDPDLIPCILLLQLRDLGLGLLHLEVRLRLLMHQRRDDDTEDDRDDDDSETPITNHPIEEVDDLEDPVFKYIPHYESISSLFCSLR